jgi:hypothetical protein
MPVPLCGTIEAREISRSLRNYDSKITSTIPQIVSKVFPTA